MPGTAVRGSRGAECEEEAEGPKQQPAPRPEPLPERCRQGLMPADAVLGCRTGFPLASGEAGRIGGEPREGADRDRRRYCQVILAGRECGGLVSSSSGSTVTCATYATMQSSCEARKPSTLLRLTSRAKQSGRQPMRREAESWALPDRCRCYQPHPRTFPSVCEVENHPRLGTLLCPKGLSTPSVTLCDSPMPRGQRADRRNAVMWIRNSG